MHHLSFLKQKYKKRNFLPKNVDKISFTKPLTRPPINCVVLPIHRKIDLSGVLLSFPQPDFTLHVGKSLQNLYTHTIIM